MKKLNLSSLFLISTLFLYTSFSCHAQGIPKLVDSQPPSFSHSVKAKWAGNIITNAPCGVCPVSEVLPLYIVDGTPVSAERMRLLAPEQIQKISVVKDKVATALYGPSATYGAILITLKK